MKIGRKIVSPSSKKERTSTSEESTLSKFRISSASFHNARNTGRRRVDFVPLHLLIIPSFCIDFTELQLRQAGERGKEKFVVWAGSLVGHTGFVSTILIPQNEEDSSFIPPNVSASAHEALDERDLIPIAQVHSHPGRAFLSPIDQQNPFFMCKGFLSVVIPNFGFVNMMDLTNWKVYEYVSVGKWSEFSPSMLAQRIVIDDSVITI